MAEPRKLLPPEAFAGQEPRDNEIEHRRLREQPARRHADDRHAVPLRDPQQAPGMRRYAMADPYPSRWVWNASS